MAVSKNNIQACVTLPREIVQLIDKQAEKEGLTRSKEIARIVIEYFNKKTD